MPPPRKPLPRRPILVGRKLSPEEVATILREAPDYYAAAETLGKTPNAVYALAHELRLDGYDVPRRNGCIKRKVDDVP